MGDGAVSGRVRIRRTVPPPVLLLLLLAPVPGRAQTDVDDAVAAALANDGVRSALSALEHDADRTATLLARLASIVSPSGAEHERARAVAHEMRALGLQRVRVDEGPNAVGVIPGRSGRALVFVSTLDDLTTVPAFQRAFGPPRISPDRVIGPGTNTSSTTAAMLAAARAFAASGLVPEHDLVFAAVAQEETGLQGMRRLYEEWRDRAVAFVDILGDGRSITYGALGIHWWKVQAEGPGGHTLQGGLPNVNQGIARAVDRIFRLPQPEAHPESRTVLNVAVLSSGEVFNHKPESGWFSLDVRSLDGTLIESIEEDVRAVLRETSAETDISFAMEAVTRIPAAQIPGLEDSELVRTAGAIARWMNLEPTFSNAGSANSNVALAGGTPAIGIGGGRGGARGSLDEWADRAAMMRTARHVFLLASILGGTVGPGAGPGRFPEAP